MYARMYVCMWYIYLYAIRMLSKITQRFDLNCVRLQFETSSVLALHETESVRREAARMERRAGGGSFLSK